MAILDHMILLTLFCELFDKWMQMTLFCFKNVNHGCKILRRDRSMVQRPEIFSVHSELTSHDAAEVPTSFQNPSLMETYTKYKASQVAQ